MIKKIFAVIFIVLGTLGVVYAQTLEVSGEMKTGLFWQKVEAPGQEVYERARIHNNDDAGSNEGRFRMNIEMKKDIIGMKVRFEQTAWSMTQPNQWAFAFAYGNFFNEQLRIVIGRLGESPWSAGGPDIWQELDNQLGIRTEYKPAFIPGLDVGFVLNTWQEANYYPEKNTLVDILMESVLGIAYTNDYFHARFSYRLDGESDVYNMESEGTQLMYRFEERALRKVVDGLSIWVNGWWKGIGTDDADIVNYQNWFYAQLAPPEFTAQLRLGYHTGVQRQELWTRLSFYYNVLDWLSVGAAGSFRIDYGDSAVRDTPYKLWNIEPQIRLTFAPNTYIAFVYSFENEPISADKDKQTQFFNLRTVFTF
ncbi:hypothetical protein [Treponema sp. R80B11-R83G3]